MTRTRLSCRYCGDPIRVSDRDPESGYEEQTIVAGNHLWAWHTRCAPNYLEPGNPFQAALQKAKQAIADAHRLGAEEYDAFCGIVALALREQR